MMIKCVQTLGDSFIILRGNQIVVIDDQIELNDGHVTRRMNRNGRMESMSAFCTSLSYDTVWRKR